MRVWVCASYWEEHAAGFEWFQSEDDARTALLEVVEDDEMGGTHYLFPYDTDLKDKDQITEEIDIDLDYLCHKASIVKKAR